MIPRSRGSASGAQVQATAFGIGPVQVSGNAAARTDSPFRLAWTGGAVLASRTADRGWVVVAPGDSSPLLRTPLRPYGAPGTFRVYLATIGASAQLTMTGSQGATRASVGGCGDAVCPYIVTITVKGAQRLDGTLDLRPTGGGSVGLAAVRQQ
jgi:hypothetical protein